jgi:hypothetical protein
MNKIFAVTFIVYVFVGCAATDSNVPVSPLLHRFEPVELSSPEYSLLYVYYPMTPVAHNPGFNTSLSVNISVDDNRIIRLPNRGYTWIELIPGNYKIGAEWPWTYGVPGPDPITTKVSVEAGKTYYLRLRHSGEGEITPGYMGVGAVVSPEYRTSDVSTRFELEYDFKKTGLPWCNYAKPDVMQWP